jgi:hypothetical protein
VIFRRDKKREREPAATPESDPGAGIDGAGEEVEATTEAGDDATGRADELDIDALDAQEWRGAGPWDIDEIDPPDEADERPRIDLGSLILTAVPGSELRLQVSEDTQQIVSAMLILETVVAATPDDGGPQAYSSALELGAYAAPRSGGLWSELRDEISQSTVEAGGSASFGSGPFGVELRRLVPVTTPDGEEGYQPSRMWVAEGPRWLLRGIVYGQAAVEEDLDSPAVREVLDAFRQVVVRRGDEAMAPGDLLPLAMPADVEREEDE